MAEEKDPIAFYQIFRWMKDGINILLNNGKRFSKYKGK